MSALIAALELHDLGLQVMRSNLRRQHPEATPGEIEALLARWINDRPLPLPPEYARRRELDG